MTPLNPAPRPCYFEGKERCPDSLLRWIEHDMSVAAFNRVSVGVENYLKEITAIYQALHPPLCMKHALEIGYEFRKGQKYLFGGDPDLEPFFHTFLEGEGVDPKQNPSHEEIIWFKPVDSEYNPTHGEAEAVVNAWKEGE